MRVTTRIRWDENWNVVEHEWYIYEGPIELACGATGAQIQLQNEQMNAYSTLESYAQQEFGDASALFQDFKTDFTPIMNAGPNQLGESTQESAAINSATINNEAAANRNAQLAAGTNLNAVGGGNEFVPQGATAATRAAINAQSAQATASQLTQNLVQNYELGRQNWQVAAQELSGATNTFNPATSGAGAATGAGSAAGTTAEQVEQANMAPYSLVASLAGSALGGLASGGLSLGGGSTMASSPSYQAQVASSMNVPGGAYETTPMTGEVQP